MPQVPISAPTAAARPIASISGRPLLVPPEEQFWKRYSPHNEFSLSGATSVAVHIIGLGLLLLLAWLFLKPVEAKTDVPDMDMVAVARLADDNVSGKPGEDTGDGGKGPQPRKEAVGQEATADDADPSTKGSTAGEALADPKEPAPVEIGHEKDGTRKVVTGTAPRDLDSIPSRRAYAALAERKSKVQKSGDGSDGTGKKGAAEVRRAKRQLRWRLTLNTLEGEIYRDELHALGAIILVPEPKSGPDGKPLRDSKGQPLLRYRLVIRDLTRNPAKPQVEDVRKLDGMFWIDDNPEQVRKLASVLGIQPPVLFAHFFPEKVEPEMRNLEKAKHSGPESDITGTEFKLIDDKNGPYKGKLGTYRLVCTEVKHD